MVYFEGVGLGRYPHQLEFCWNLTLESRDLFGRKGTVGGPDVVAENDELPSRKGFLVHSIGTGRHNFLPLLFRLFLPLTLLLSQLYGSAVDVQQINKVWDADVDQNYVNNSHHHESTILPSYIEHPIPPN